MNKIISIAIVTALGTALALAGCGGKANKATTPENKGGATSTTTEVKGTGSATGGTTYGGATTPGAPDPCGG